MQTSEYEENKKQETNTLNQNPNRRTKFLVEKEGSTKSEDMTSFLGLKSSRPPISSGKLNNNIN